MRQSTSPVAPLCLIVLFATTIEIACGLCHISQAQDEPSKKTVADVKPKTGEQSAEASGPKELYPNFGVVVDEQGRPLAGVSVDCLPLVGRRTSMVTDAEGKFPLSASTSFPVHVARHEDGRQGILTWIPYKKMPSLRITLKPARELKVSVVEENGSPVGGAQVVVQAAGIMILASGLTDGDGRWTTKLPADAELDQVFAAKSRLGFDYLCGLAADSSLQHKPLPDKIALKLAGARTARIKAVDSSGEPIAGASVSVWLIKIEGQTARVNLSGWGFSTVVTDASGVAVFDWLPRNAAGSVAFMGGSADYSSTKGVRIGPGHEPVELEMPMVRRSKIEGRVGFPDGRPAVNIRVNGRGFPTQYGGQSRTVTREDGSYELHVNGEQAYIVSVDDEHWVAPSHGGVIVREGNDVAGIDFTLTEGTILRGKVTVGPDHHPAPNYYVSLLMQAGEIPNELKKRGAPASRMTDVRPAKTDADGEFRFRVPRGAYELGGLFGLKRVTLTITDEREVVRDIDMPRLLTNLLEDYVEFNVADADNQLGPGAMVVATPRSPAFEWPVVIEALESGKFRLPIALIPVVLQARTTDGRFAGIARVETDTHPRTIRLVPAGIALGRLLDDKGQAVEGGRLRCGIRVYEDEATKGRFGIAPSGGIVTTGSDGSFELRGLVPSEEYVLEFEPEPESNRWSLVTTVKANMAESFELGDIRLQASE